MPDRALEQRAVVYARFGGGRGIGRGQRAVHGVAGRQKRKHLDEGRDDVCCGHGIVECTHRVE